MIREGLCSLLACGMPLQFYLGVYVLPPMLAVFFVVTGTRTALKMAEESRQSRIAARRAGGICVKCGYDLRATPRRCPECGTYPAEFSTGVMLSDSVLKWCESARNQTQFPPIVEDD